MGFLKPNSGNCLIFGEPSHNLSAQIKKDIALLYEGFITYDFMSIKEIEKYFASFYQNWNKKVFYELINLLYKPFFLNHFLHFQSHNKNSLFKSSP